VSDLEPIGRHLGRAARLPAVDPLVLEARRVWRQAVGGDVARNATPVRRAGDALVVHCSSSVWAGELSMLERQIRAGLAGLMANPPARLRFEVGHVPPPEPPTPPPEPLRRLTEEEAAGLLTLVDGVSDPALAERIREAAELSLRRRS
jgi:Dna[CI] antecedent, DciA